MNEEECNALLFSVDFGVGKMKFIRRSVARPPAEGTVCFVSWGTLTDAARQTGGLYRNGEWRSSRGKRFDDQPTHYTMLDA